MAFVNKNSNFYATGIQNISTIIKINLCMLFREINGIYCEKHKNHIRKLCQNAKFTKFISV